MAKRKRSSKRASHRRGNASPATSVATPTLPEPPRSIVPRPRHLARSGKDVTPGRRAEAGVVIQPRPARWTDRPERTSRVEPTARRSTRPAERPRSPWHVNGFGSLFAFFGPLLSAIVGCQALVVILLGQQLPDPSWPALSALFLAMLAMDYLAIRPLIGRHHRDFLPRLCLLLGASALPAVALLLVRRLS